MLIDSHCHLNFLDDPHARLTAARALGVERFLCIGVDQAGIGEVLALAEAHEDVWATVGQHPDAAGTDLGWLREHLAHPRVVAAGEMGLDYFHERDPAGQRRQLDCFDQQLALADELGLPVVIHTRAAESDTLDRLRAHPGVTGVLHCFTESWEMAAAALDMGYYVSMSGIVTFKSADSVRDVARRIPDDRLLVETDSPWLAPVPHRGQPNEPAFLPDTAAFVADLRGQNLTRLAELTSANFQRLFKAGSGPGE